MGKFLIRTHFVLVYVPIRYLSMYDIWMSLLLWSECVDSRTYMKMLCLCYEIRSKQTPGIEDVLRRWIKGGCAVASTSL